MEIMEKTLATTITEAREQAGLSIDELHKLLGISICQLRSIERGKAKKPRPSTLRSLSTCLKLDINSLKEMAGYSTTVPIPTYAKPTAELGLIIKNARLAATLSQSELSELSGIELRHICNLELGNIKRPKRSNLVILADVLNLDLKILTEKAGFSTPEINHLGDAIRAARYKKNMSISDVAFFCGISQSHVIDIENGKTEHLHETTLEALSEMLELNLENLKHLASVNP